ncbi:MAG TPA: SDR family oxidoreductase [Geminicoccaceae bacterium]|nr:SDR family oxidoreductase [Geminicoccaceae bacterium]
MSGRAALVTGGARRLGRAIALDLARHGWDVAVHYGRSAAEAEEVVAAIGRLGGGRRAVALRAELAEESEVEGLVGRAAEGLGRPLALLVNNAAVFAYDRPETAGRASWDAHMAVNLRAPLVLTQRFVAQLPPEAVEGHVVNLIDQRVWNLTPNYTSYTVSKAGLWALTRHLALALAPRVRVNAIGPGLALPGPGQSEADFRALAGAAPLGRSTSPEEVAAALRFLIDSSSVTGQMIALDGGQHLGWLTPGGRSGGAADR